jgi:gamma-glutamylcyclotransferase (GGCT)/AIG2-like uncharacterized protein YtfP
MREPLIKKELTVMGDQLVFVYGTLRAGERNHRLLGKATLVARQGRIIGELTDTGYGYPAAHLTGCGFIYGEVYAVDAETLAALDQLEGYN